MKVQIDGKDIMEISDTDLACLNNDLLSIEEWIKGAVIGKINNCKKRMMSEWQPKLIADPDTEFIPASESGMVDMIVNHKNYKDRTKRDEEEKGKEEIK